MTEKKVPVYPIANLQVSVNAEKNFVMLNMPYFTGLNTEKQHEHHDHAYGMLAEHAELLRDLLNDALQRIAEAKG